MHPQRSLEQDWQLAKAGHGPDATVVVVNVVIDAETLEQAADHEPQSQRPSEDATSYRAETLSGQRLSPQQILMCALAGHVRRVVLSASTIDFEMSKKVRLFKGAKRTETDTAKVEAATSVPTDARPPPKIDARDPRIAQLTVLAT